MKNKRKRKNTQQEEETLQLRDAILRTIFELMKQTHIDYGHMGAHAFLINFECQFTTVDLQRNMYDIVLKTCPNCNKLKQDKKERKSNKQTT